MRDRDLADSSLASYRPEPPPESLGNLLREALAPFIERPRQPAAWQALDAVLAEADSQDAQADRMRIVFETLRAIYGDSRLPLEVRRQAVAAAIGANDPFFGESYQFYADQFGVTRQCLHSGARSLQQRYGLRARRDKRDETRETCRTRASGPRASHPPRPVNNVSGQIFAFFKLG